MHNIGDVIVNKIIENKKLIGRYIRKLIYSEVIK